MTHFSRLKQMLGEALEFPEDNESDCNVPLLFGQEKKNVQGEAIDVEQLRKDCWLGIPNTARPLAWRLLSVKFRTFFAHMGHRD
jgi:hypothetical protein